MCICVCSCIRYSEEHNPQDTGRGGQGLFLTVRTRFSIGFR